jgi:hypothetical protein
MPEWSRPRPPFLTEPLCSIRVRGRADQLDTDPPQPMPKMPSAPGMALGRSRRRVRSAGGSERPARFRPAVQRDAGGQRERADRSNHW